ncbi:hypothetical protein GCM10020255_104150 [Rhodococcus baikonurensis]
MSEWSIQELAKSAGTTSRTLRHYGDLGLLEPSRIGANGYRFYDEDALVRLQRILLLRELGLGLRPLPKSSPVNATRPPRCVPTSNSSSRSARGSRDRSNRSTGP